MTAAGLRIYARDEPLPPIEPVPPPPSHRPHPQAWVAPDGALLGAALDPERPGAVLEVHFVDDAEGATAVAASLARGELPRPT